MNDTAILRESIRGRTGTFVASDFDADNAAGILNKMYIGGELEVCGFDKGKNGRPVKRYKIVKLREFKMKREPKTPIVYRKDRPREIPLYVQLWSLVYPDLFVLPDFSGYKQTLRTFKGD